MTTKVALVTGAGRGIGRACALALHDIGFELVLVGRREAPLAELAGELAGDPLVVPTDVADSVAVDHLFSQIEQRFGRLDLLFNNAGLNIPSTEFGDIEEADWRALVDVNLTGAFLCARAAYRLMKRQSPAGGRIINNGSISAHVPRPGSAPYTASKHAITGLTRSIALDGRAHGINCGQIDIGNAASDMADAMTQGVPQADGRMAAEPVMAVDNVATAIRFMAELPPDVNVPFMTIMASGMPYIGRG
ncbi:SDR family oxidoreductase [Salinisphaera hydrothermalis]|uniref:Short-chain dehydrogenase/reductase SDR n=1 Tax=Salinisphaera hydrothermalis (strain C41B8) TaxID=1304275 RepID=A0A084IL10_SALHC|nr:SDR family oxidoreductase [Salinisphaera hydrothermalis]KEZ77394.1 short-chain dehydrogenase/reductase SDR [Salinisphaera hydrothermalis C41B8]